MTEIDISKGIQVGGFHFAVKTDTRTVQDLRADRDYGQCDLMNHAISLDVGQEPVQVSKTFIHECLEAVNNIYCDNALEHRQIQQLSFGLHQIMESLEARFVVAKSEPVG